MTREDRPPPGNPPTEAPADGAASASRREFFRAFSRQTVASAGSVVGAVAELRRTGSSAARELFSLGLDDPDASAARMSAAVASPTATAAPAATVGDPGFSSPYLVLEGSLRLLDVRQLPERNAFADCRHPSEVAAAIRSGVVNDGPVLAPIAAYALVMAIEATIERPDFSRQQAWGSAASALRSARPHVRALSWAIDRMERRYVMLGPTGDGGELLAGLRQEADAIAAGQALAHARLGSAGADALLDREAPTGQPPAAERRQMQLMMHGDMGPLSCGQVGTGGALVAALVAAGRDVHVWLTDALPSGEGRRLAALQLSRQDIASTSLPDSAVGWLFANRQIDALLLRGDRVHQDGSITAPIGSLPAATSAAGLTVPVYACAPLSAFEAGAAAAESQPPALRSPAEVEPEAGSAGRRTGRLSPPADTLPARLLTGLVTERGVIAAEADAIAAALAQPEEEG